MGFPYSWELTGNLIEERLSTFFSDKASKVSTMEHTGRPLASIFQKLFQLEAGLSLYLVNPMFTVRFLDIPWTATRSRSINERSAFTLTISSDMLSNTSH